MRCVNALEFALLYLFQCAPIRLKPHLKTTSRPALPLHDLWPDRAFPRSTDVLPMTPTSPVPFTAPPRLPVTLHRQRTRKNYSLHLPIRVPQRYNRRSSAPASTSSTPVSCWCLTWRGLHASFSSSPPSAFPIAYAKWASWSLSIDGSLSSRPSLRHLFATSRNCPRLPSHW